MARLERDVKFKCTGGARGWPGDVPVVRYDVDKIDIGLGCFSDLIRSCSHYHTTADGHHMKRDNL